MFWPKDLSMQHLSLINQAFFEHDNKAKLPFEKGLSDALCSLVIEAEKDALRRKLERPFAFEFAIDYVEQQLDADSILNSFINPF